MDNAPAHPDAETLKAENITCIFMPPNTTAILQPMDQSVIESMKRTYRKQFLRKLLFEGDDDEEEAACSIVQFWKALTLEDFCTTVYVEWILRPPGFSRHEASASNACAENRHCLHDTNEAWESVPEHTLKRSWRKLAPYLENVDQSNDSGSVTVTELNGLLKQISGCGNCEEDDVTSWLDCDSGFQLMSDDEIIAQVRKPNSDDDNNESDEDKVIETSKINYSDAFECFAKGLMWLEQQTDSDSTESSRWRGVEVWRGGCQLRCRPRHLTEVQNYEVRPKIALVLLQNGTLI
ncbi:Jerky -like [Araneus ventricosus]|uniref:Jerky-like n=1 Tax=Araneus ventricosus TaxID=182803 RepID=A0A4Y2AFX6_ARAVE|nr:Jerky -like [Araneus ventricosus]